jgi:hypothetical protein
MRDPKGPVKPYKSPQEISTQHKVPLATVMKQVKMGTKVEGEHTTSKSGARITALQHVDELPDYYTRLKKVEKKTTKEEMEMPQMVSNQQRYCPKCKKCETSSECKYGENYWKMFSIPMNLAPQKFSIATVHPGNMPEETAVAHKPATPAEKIRIKKMQELERLMKAAKGPRHQSDVTKNEEYELDEDHKEIASGKKKDEEGYMANIEMDKIEKSVEILRKIIKSPNQQLPAWVQSKITRAADFIDTAADYLSSDEEVSEACWVGYKQVGMKKKGKKMVPNCVPANEDTCLTFSEFMQIAEVAAWQRKEGKNREGGLNEKGRKSYERENPGSDLKAPSKKVGNPRRASFCARMSGMKKKLTSSKTANDPNSRINKSLRAWNC